jgi:hypothetical protein
MAAPTPILSSNEATIDFDHSVTDVFVEMLARPNPSKIQLGFCRDGSFPYGVNGDDPRIRRLLHHYFPAECPLIVPSEARTDAVSPQLIIEDATDGPIVDVPVRLVIDESPKPVHKPPVARRKRKRSQRTNG